MSSPKNLSDARRYDAYIDSGTEWLGEVPAHWQITRIKGVFRAFGSGSTPTSSEPAYYDEGTIPWLNTADLNNGVVYDTRRRVTPKAVAETSLRMYPKGTLAIAMYGQGETRGNVGLMAIESTANQASLMMHRSFNSVPRFMLWWFVARKYSIRQINIGTTQPNMNQDFVRNLVICLPPHPEQQAIAAYLDAKTARIDRRIDLLTQKAAKYRQLKQSLINEAVTRGLDKSVPMKDSEAEWIDRIPAHWRICHLKRCVKSKITDGPHESPEYFEEGVPFISAEAVQDYGINFDSRRGFISPEQDLIYSQKCKPKRDDIFIVKSGSTTGKIGYAATDVDFQIWSPLALVRTNSEHFSRFVFHFLTSLYFQTQVRVSWSMGTQPNIGMGVLENLQIVAPPLIEQRAIAEFLDARLSQIDCIIAPINAQIEKLKELRKALINDVVTGKLRVT